MWQQQDEQGSAEVRHGVIACYTCRRRKVRCDRELPQCRVCEQTGQDCKYPPKARKPGPKIGSVQRQKHRIAGSKGSKRGQRQGCTRREEGDGSEEDVCLRTRSPLYSESPATSSQEHVNDASQGGDSHLLGHDDWVPVYTSPGQRPRLNMQSLSFILHPCHEALSPDRDDKCQSPGRSRDHIGQPLLRDACRSLGLSVEMVDKMIQRYFSNMVAINLFHQPTFHDKLSSIESKTQLCALLAAMVCYASHFQPENSILNPGLTSHDLPRPDMFLKKALALVDEALAECDDEPPPICVVQALVIATHCQLTRGVHGKAWRSLGLCVRLAYELNLHLIDADDTAHSHPHQSPLDWRHDEERRRVWWAIWEMDVFGSSIKRTPTAVSWSQMETYLPVDDYHWFRDDPVPSTFMEKDPSQRWKALQSTHNESPKAWFIVINSLMKDAQILSSPHGVHVNTNTSQRWSGKTHRDTRRDAGRKDKKTVQQLEVLRNAVQCFVLALPSHLRYRSQYLNFDQATARLGTSYRQLHCHIYNIFVMTQLARLMIYRHDLFREPAGEEEGWPSQGGLARSRDASSLSQYFEAADNILAIVHGSCEEHIQYINPLLLSGIWLASAVQLVRRCVEKTPAKACLIKSRFDVLYLTYKRCVDFWDTKTALQENLEILEGQLEAHFEGAPNVTDTPSPEKRRRSRAPSWIRDKDDKMSQASPSLYATRHDQDAARSDFSPTLGVLHVGAAQNSASQTISPVTSMAYDSLGSHLAFSQDGSMGALLSPTMTDPPRPQQQQGLALSQQCQINGQSIQLPLSPQTMINEDGSDASQPMLDMGYMPSLEMVSDFDPNPTLGGLEPIDFIWRGDQLPLVVQDLLSGMSTF